MTFDTLKRALGEPAQRGERPIGSASWRPAGDEHPRSQYAVWDCNACLEAVRRGEQALDGLATDRSFDDDITVLRGVLGHMLGVCCCMARQSDPDQGDWTLISTCAKHDAKFFER
jgi:hypothetical protein